MRLRWMLVLVTALLAAAFVVAALSLNRLIAANRVRILAAAHKAAGREIRADKIEAAVWGRPGVRLVNVQIADDPGFGPEPFVEAKSVAVRVQLRPLLGGRIELSRVELDGPRIRVVRGANGDMNYASLSRRGPAASGGGAGGESGASSVVVAVAIVEIDDGTLTLVDRSVSPPKTTTINGIRARTSGVDGERPIRFDLRAAVNGAAENVRLEGEIGPLTVSGVPFAVTGALGPIGGWLPRVDAVEVAGRGGSDAVRVESFRCLTLGGKIEASATLPAGASGRLRLSGKTEGLDVARLAAFCGLEWADEVEGRLRAEFDVGAAGRDASALRDSIEGTVAAEVKDGVLANFNLAGEIMKRAAKLPGLRQALEQRMGPKRREVIDRRETRFERVNTRLRLGGRRVQVDELVAIADDASTRATGWLTFDREADVRGQVELSPALSSELTHEVKEFGLFADEQGRIVLPFRYRGVLGEAKPEPDISKLGPVLDRVMTGAGAERLLDKLLGGGAGNTPPEDGDERPPEGSLERRLREMLGR